MKCPTVESERLVNLGGPCSAGGQMALPGDLGRSARHPLWSHAGSTPPPTAGRTDPESGAGPEPCCSCRDGRLYRMAGRTTWLLPSLLSRLLSQDEPPRSPEVSGNGGWLLLCSMGTSGRRIEQALRRYRCVKCAATAAPPPSGTVWPDRFARARTPSPTPHRGPVGRHWMSTPPSLLDSAATWHDPRGGVAVMSPVRGGELR